jgi:hypothetical protein
MQKVGAVKKKKKRNGSQETKQDAGGYGIDQRRQI